MSNLSNFVLRCSGANAYGWRGMVILRPINLGTLDVVMVWFFKLFLHYVSNIHSSDLPFFKGGGGNFNQLARSGGGLWKLKKRGAGLKDNLLRWSFLWNQLTVSAVNCSHKKLHLRCLEVSKYTSVVKFS